MPNVSILTDDPIVIDELIKICASAGLKPTVISIDTKRDIVISTEIILLTSDKIEHVRYSPAKKIIVMHEKVDDSATKVIWRKALSIKAEELFFIPEEEQLLLAALSNISVGDNTCKILLSIGAKGGSGSSTWACGLSYTLSERGYGTVLVDLDEFGGGLDFVLGVESREGLRWEEIQDIQGKVLSRQLANAMPTLKNLSLLSFTRCGKNTISEQNVINIVNALRNEFQFIVIDSSRSNLCNYLLEESHHIALVMQLTMRNLIAAVTLQQKLKSIYGINYSFVQQKASLITRGPIPGTLTSDDANRVLEFSEMINMKHDSNLDLDLEHGLPPGSRSRSALKKACDKYLEQVVGV